MNKGIFLSRIMFAAAVSLWLAGCASSPPARFYTLTPLGAGEAQPSAPAVTSPASVSVAQVEIPDYLNRPQIVTRDGRNELRLAEFDRWAGSLSDNIAAVLAEDLALILGSDRVYVSDRMRAEKADYSVAIQILRLDCVPGDQVLLKAQWTLFAGPERKDAATRMMTFTERVGDQRYETLVAAVSATLGKVSREIAREIPAPKQ